MNRLTHRARRAIAGAVVAVPLFASACTFKDQLLQPQQPQIILPQDVGGVTRRRGALYRARSADSSRGRWAATSTRKASGRCCRS